MVQLLVMLDDFTEENGATYLLTGSHRQRERPSSEEFFRGAVRAIGPAGSIVVFDSNLWHAAGVNRSEPAAARADAGVHATLHQTTARLPASARYECGDSYSPALRQLLGYNARVPTSLDEWYQPPQKRLYKPDQG